MGYNLAIMSTCSTNCSYSLVAGSELNVSNLSINSSNGLATYTIVDETLPFGFSILEVCTTDNISATRTIVQSFPARTTCATVTSCLDYGQLATEVLANLPGSDELVINPNGTITHTALDGTIVIVDLKKAKIEDLGGNSYRITDDYGSQVTFTIPTLYSPATLVDNADGTFTFDNSMDPPVTIDMKLATVTDLGGSQYQVEDDSGNIVTFYGPAPAVVTDNADGTFDFDNNVDTPVTIDFRIATVVNNGGGSFTVTDDFGTTINFTVPASSIPATLTDNLDDTWTFDNNVDTPVTIDIRKATIQSLGGNNYRITDDFGNTVDVTSGTFSETITLLGRTGDELTFDNEDASNPNVDLSDFRVTVTNNLDGTYDIDDGVGNLGTIDTVTGVSSDANNSLSDGADGKPYYHAMSTASSQEFTASGTYTIPEGATVIEVHLIGGGGGGGGGHANSTPEYSDGGAGGSGGQYTFHKYTATELGGTGTNITVTIGAGGTSGAGGTFDGNDNQVAGGTGGSSTFGNFLIALGGNGGGISNTLNNNVPTGGVGVSFIGHTSGNGGDAGCYQGSYQAATAGQTAVAAPGGGGGGAHGNGSTGGAGGVGFSTSYRTRTTTPGGASGSNGTADTTTTHNGGGGGGTRNSNVGGAGGAGARGGGGGGGGGSTNSVAGGAGGAGGAGYCIVYAY